MSANTARLSLVVLLLAAALARADAGDKTPPIEALKGVRPQAAAYKGGRPGEPVVIRSADDAAKHFPEKSLEAIRQKVDFKKQIVLLFAWRGSGQDRLTYSVAESCPEQVTFRYRPGRTRDLRPHAYVYALRSNVKWHAPRTPARRSGGTPPNTTRDLKPPAPPAKGKDQTPASAAASPEHP